MLGEELAKGLSDGDAASLSDCGPDTADPIEPGTGPAAFIGAFNSSSTGSGALGASGCIIGSVADNPSGPPGWKTGLTGALTTSGLTTGLTGSGVDIGTSTGATGDSGAGVTGDSGAVGATPGSETGVAGGSGTGVAPESGIGVGVGLFIGSIFFFLQNY